MQISQMMQQSCNRLHMISLEHTYPLTMWDMHAREIASVLSVGYHMEASSTSCASNWHFDVDTI